MGNDEAPNHTKSEKALSLVQEQLVGHPYPDWAAVQAYYGPGVPMPLYFNAAVAAGHPPHPYMWGPQALIPSFATPYAAIYPHAVYAHHAWAPPSTTDVPAKSSNSKDRGLMKKLKGFDGLAVSIGNVNTDITVGDGSGQSQSSGENGAEALSDASNENNGSGGKDNQRKRSSGDTPTSGEKKAGVLFNAAYAGETNATIDASTGVVVSPPPLACKPMHNQPASSQQPSGVEFRTCATSQLKAGVHPEPLTQDGREMKRERRKQSNRESARRSRLRKQAEAEELAMKVETMAAENTTLRSEIVRLKENSEKLKAENSSLQEKLKNVQDNSPDNLENEGDPPVVVENFLSRIDENSNGGRLHRLLDSSPRTDAVAAG